MPYVAKVINSVNFSQVDNFDDERDALAFNQMKADYPLLFIAKEHSIVFYNMRIKLNNKQYEILFQLVKNATENGNNKGLSAMALFNSAHCKHNRENSVTDKTPEERADERIRDYKRQIKKAIITEYKKLEIDFNNKNKQEITEFNNKIKQFAERAEQNKDCINYKLPPISYVSKVINPIGIHKYLFKESVEYFLENILLNESSPYIFFDINSAFESLFYNTQNKEKKYTTEFVFKDWLTIK